MQNRKKTFVAIAVALVLIVALVLCWNVFGQKAGEGDKTITVQVNHIDGTVAEWTIKTDSENLRGALESENLIAGDDSGATMFVTMVDGYTADSSREEWWCFTKDGEMMMTGVDDTMIADGDKYEITLTVGYDW